MKKKKNRKMVAKLRAALGEAATRFLTQEDQLPEEYRDPELIARARRWLELSKEGE